MRRVPDCFPQEPRSLYLTLIDCVSEEIDSLKMQFWIVHEQLGHREDPWNCVRSTKADEQELTVLRKKSGAIDIETSQDIDSLDSSVLRIFASKYSKL